MIDFFRYQRLPSHYREEIGPTITVTKPILSTNEKVVEACKDLDAYAREYTPAAELTTAQRKWFQALEKEREINRALYDNGLWSPSYTDPSFKVREG